MRRWIVLGVLGALVLGYYAYETLEAPASQFFGPTVVSGPVAGREIALTFDDGPNPPYTERILDVLRDERVHATFFVVGRAAQAYPATLRRIVREGNALGNHTWDHAHLPMHSLAAIRAELQRTDDVVARITGMRPRLMRPPFGSRDFAVIAEARREGYRVVMWSVPLPNDWEQPGARTIADRVIAAARPGSIIVLHDGNRGLVCERARARACDRTQEVAATRRIVETLGAAGYRFVTVPQLLSSGT